MSMKCLILTGVLAMMSAPLLHAKEETVVVEGIVGGTIEEAITHGLVRALEQVMGTKIVSNAGMKKKHAQAILEIQSGMEQYAGSLSLEGTSFGEVSQATRGIIKSYKILEQNRETAQKWVITLEVVVPVYDAKNPRPGEKRTMVVLPFEPARSSFQVTNLKLSAADLVRKLQARSEVHFTQSNKFNLLDREFLGDILSEQDFINTSRFNLDEQLKLGNMVGADFLVVGTLEEFSWKEVPFEVKVTGYKGVNIEARYNLACKVIDVATGEIAWSDNLGLSNVLDMKDIRAADANMKIDDYLVEQAARELAATAVLSIFPVKVIGKSQGKVVLNAGESRVAVGDQFEIYAIGEGFVDPDTGEKLADEILVASVRIVRVTERMAYAELVDGDLDAIPVPSLCRRKE
jgi:curli biogenesis system outer membrane secretion channel CsgG